MYMDLQEALYLVPVEINPETAQYAIPEGTRAVASGIRVWIVENLRTARRTLRRWNRDFPIDSCTFFELNGHTNPREISSFLNPLRNGIPTGVMSEAGCPAVADPGADVVALAQNEGLKVIPLVGPSSILMSLMASGFNGQGFTFNGYLPAQEPDRIRAVRELEFLCTGKHVTQIFIETPYRNRHLFETLCSVLRPDTLLCVATDITDCQSESIVTLPVAEWKRRKPLLERRNTIFLIHRN